MAYQSVTVETEEEIAEWISAHQGHELRPLDLIWGIVEVVEGEPFLFDDGMLEYTPAGWTDVIWDSQATVGVQCRSCDQDRMVLEWIRDVVPTTTTEQDREERTEQ